MKKKLKTKKVKEYGYGILNAYGDFWTYHVFASPSEAEHHMELFWGNIKNPPDMSKHTIVPVEITYTLPIKE